MEIITESAQETKNLGKKIGADLKGGAILALTGELGSGKTTFLQGLAQGLGIKQRIISPTFILLRKYEIPEKAGEKDINNFYHIDLYRLEDNIDNEVTNLGVDDLLGKAENIVAIEWAEKIKQILPKNTIWVKFENLRDEKRRITIV